MDRLEGPTEESQLINYLRVIHEERDSKSICSMPIQVEATDTGLTPFI
jgi:hypothetical protein